MANNSRVILVTGAGGQLGNEMQRVAEGSSDRYIFTDVAELDITNKSAVEAFVSENEVSAIVNCAAYTNVDKAEDDAECADLINNIAVRNLADAAKSCDALLVHVSTDYVFDGKGTRPYVESDAADPIGVYGVTKLAGEKSVEESGCRYVILRTSWLYSAWGNNFVKTMLRLTSERDELSVVADQFGTPTFAGDLADVIASVIDQEAVRGEQVHGVYHYSNSGVCTWFDFAVAVGEMAGNSEKCAIKAIESKDFPSRVTRPSYSVLDKSKVATTFGVVVPEWRESLLKCMKQLLR
ncbi:MAG: dTDP-4-dehydrorhamnose reductase [Rikenellaceae bacterium]